MAGRDFVDRKSIIRSIEIYVNNAAPAIAAFSKGSAKVIHWRSQDFISSDPKTVNCGFSRRDLFKVKS